MRGVAANKLKPNVKAIRFDQFSEQSNVFPHEEAFIVELAGHCRKHGVLNASSSSIAGGVAPYVN